MDSDPQAPHETLQHPVEVISYDGSGCRESQIHTESHLLLGQLLGQSQFPDMVLETWNPFG